MTPQRVTLITLGVADLTRSRRFYEALGWRAAAAQDGVVFFQMLGSVMGLFDLKALAEDQGRAGAGRHRRDDAGAELCDTGRVDAGRCAKGRRRDGEKAPRDVFWGGYSGYYADPDGHVWEIAMNPFWPLSADGSLTLPPPDANDA